MPLLAELRARLPVASSFEGVVLLSGDSTRALLACTVAGLPKELLLLRGPTTSTASRGMPNGGGEATLHVYALIEHGRRWYRNLEYTSDISMCLAELHHDAISLRDGAISPGGRTSLGDGAISHGDHRPSGSAVTPRWQERSISLSRTLTLTLLHIPIPIPNPMPNPNPYSYP